MKLWLFLTPPVKRCEVTVHFSHNCTSRSFWQSWHDTTRQYTEAQLLDVETCLYDDLHWWSWLRLLHSVGHDLNLVSWREKKCKSRHVHLKFDFNMLLPSNNIWSLADKNSTDNCWQIALRARIVGLSVQQFCRTFLFLTTNLFLSASTLNWLFYRVEYKDEYSYS